MAKKDQDLLQTIVTKIARGLIISTLLSIISFIIIYFAVRMFCIFQNYTVPGWFKPVTIIVATIVTIIIIVSYFKRQYFILKQGYQNLEQNMAQAAQDSLNNTNYTVYPQNNNFNNNNGFNNNQW